MLSFEAIKLKWLPEVLIHPCRKRGSMHTYKRQPHSAGVGVHTGHGQGEPQKSKHKDCWAGLYAACCCLRKACLEWPLNKNKKAGKMVNVVIRMLWWERAEVLQTDRTGSGDFMARKWSSRAARKGGGEETDGWTS